MEVYVKTVTGLGPKEEYQVCFVGFLGCFVFDLYYVFDALFFISVSPILISAFKTSTLLNRRRALGSG